MPLLPEIGDPSAQTLIELAVVLPVFFLLLLGVFQFAIVLFGYGNASYASRAGVRYASVRSASSISPCNTASVRTLVMGYLYVLPSNTVTITTTWPAGNIVGGTVNVTVKVVYAFSVPFYSSGPITISSASQRVIVN